MSQQVVRAKFFVTEVARLSSGQGRIKMNAVCRGEDNKQWASYTPAASLEMTIRNDAAIARFEPGDEFYVDFTPAEKSKEG